MISYELDLWRYLFNVKSRLISEGPQNMLYTLAFLHEDDLKMSGGFYTQNIAVDIGGPDI